MQIKYEIVVEHKKVFFVTQFLNRKNLQYCLSNKHNVICVEDIWILITSMACCTKVLLCSHMFFRILLAAVWRAGTLDLEATVRG